MKNNLSTLASATLIVVACFFASVNSGCGLISGLLGGPIVQKDTIKVADGFSDFQNDKRFNAMLTQPVVHDKLLADKDKEGNFKDYNDIFRQSAALSASARQMKFGLTKIKNGEVKLAIKIDPSMISGGPAGIAAKRNQIVSIDEQTKFGLAVIESVLKSKDEMKGKVDALTSKISSLKPQEDFKGKEATGVKNVLDGIKEAKSNLATATADLEESVKILGDLAK